MAIGKRFSLKVSGQGRSYRVAIRTDRHRGGRDERRDGKDDGSNGEAHCRMSVGKDFEGAAKGMGKRAEGMR